LHTPVTLLQPKGQVVRVSEYVQPPAAQEPGAVGTTLMVPEQRGDGGCWQVTPWHGSALHKPPLQPKGHEVSVCV
jgi:hypothetical protein